jgi:hypothetical protein
METKICILFCIIGVAATQQKAPTNVLPFLMVQCIKKEILLVSFLNIEYRFIFY